MTGNEVIEKIKTKGYWEILFEPLGEKIIERFSKCKELMINSSVELRGWDSPISQSVLVMILRSSLVITIGRRGSIGKRWHTSSFGGFIKKVVNLFTIGLFLKTGKTMLYKNMWNTILH